MGYRQSLSSSFSDRIGWYFITLSAEINTFLHTRNAAKIAQTLVGMRSHVEVNHPDKLDATNDLIDSIETMIEKLEIAMDA